MLLNESTCVANQYGEQSKDRVIDDARKTDQQSMVSPDQEQSTFTIINALAVTTENLLEFLKTLFHKGKVIKRFIMHNNFKEKRTDLF